MANGEELTADGTYSRLPPPEHSNQVLGKFGIEYEFNSGKNDQITINIDLGKAAESIKKAAESGASELSEELKEKIENMPELPGVTASLDFDRNVCAHSPRINIDANLALSSADLDLSKYGLQDIPLIEARANARQIAIELPGGEKLEIPRDRLKEGLGEYYEKIGRPLPDKVLETLAQVTAKAMDGMSAIEDAGLAALKKMGVGVGVDDQSICPKPVPYSGSISGSGGLTDSRSAQFPADHPDRALFDRVRSEVSPTTSDEKVAEAVLATRLGGIKNVAGVDGVYVVGERLFVEGAIPGFRGMVDLSSPSPPIEKTVADLDGRRQQETYGEAQRVQAPQTQGIASR